MRKTRCTFIGAILGALLPLGQPAFPAGTIPVALVQQSNQNGVPLAGCLLYLYVTGTVATPQLAFQDTNLTQALPWPVPCDANGRLPMFYVADGSIHPRLTDASGIVQFDYPSMLVIGPSGGGGGGGGTIDPTTIASSGDIKFRPTSETLTGWVKLNGTTIGSTTSGASQRANADTQGLYVYLWNNCPDATCPVSTGRGANGLADFNANKTITLLDLRGRGPLGLDDMGATAAGRLTGGLFASGNATTAQSVGGEAAHTITQAQLPNVSFPVTDPGHVHTYAVLTTGSSGALGGFRNVIDPSITPNTSSATTGITVASGGSGTAINNLSPFMLGTWFQKL